MDGREAGRMLLPVNATLLDACVLATLEKGDTYGYRITQELAAGIFLAVFGALGVAESIAALLMRR